MNRKEFLSQVLCTSGAVITGTYLITSCEQNDEQPSINGEITVDLNNNPELQSEGGYIYKKDIIIVNTGNNNFIALSKICTHQQCTVEYNESKEEVTCPCHGSAFNQKGEVLDGPASDPLKSFDVTKQDNTLTIKETG